jgi:hypothetical protein
MHHDEDVDNEVLYEKAWDKKLPLLNTDKQKENVRKAVSATYHELLDKIYEVNNKCGKYLENKIKIGKVCKYTPDKDNPIPWYFE